MRRKACGVNSCGWSA